VSGVLSSIEFWTNLSRTVSHFWTDTTKNIFTLRENPVWPTLGAAAVATASLCVWA